MRIGMQAWGSEGDIRPLLALAGGLSKAGHEVKLIATMPIVHKSYREIAEKLNVELTYVATPIVKDIEELNELGHSIVKESNPLKQTALITNKLFYPVQNDMFSASTDLCKESDLIIGHFFLYTTQVAAEKYRKPNVTVTLSHNVIPSHYVSPTGVPDIGKWAYPLWWKLVRHIVNKSLLKKANELRNRLGLSEVKDIMLDVWPAKILNLIGVSPIFCQKQRDWRQNHQVCGFLNLSENSQAWEMPHALKEYLNNGDPPVYMNFGSMMPLKIEERKKIFELFRESAKLADCRIIIQIYESEQDMFQSDKDVFYTPPVDHKKIFPYCSAVVHHGGSGTTQTATYSGVPSIVVPHISDQTFWGTELKRLGIAPGVININKVTPKKLSERIRLVLSSSQMKEKARQIGREMQQENGVGRAVELIEDYCGK